MQQEFVVALRQRLIHNLLVEFGTQRYGGHRLRFTPRKHGQPVGTGQVIHFALNWADFIELPAVEAVTLISSAKFRDASQTTSLK